MDTDDLEKNLKLSIEQYLDATIKITYRKGRAIVTASKKKLKSLYPFELVQTDHPLEVMLGYNTEGERVFLNIEEAPHVLIAGMTGSGKSVCLRSITTSLLLLKDVDIHLVDFQRVELSLFKKYVSSFCSEPLVFSKLLAELKKESDKRLVEFERAGVVNISSYNSRSKNKFRYIVVIVDEFATLSEHENIMNALKLRVAQDRKCGIHYIFSTQRPTSTDKIISGTLKANMPVRIAFKCADDTNSQVILDCKGAEDLRGKGHGILLTNELTEFQCLFLSETEAMELVKPLKQKEVTKHAVSKSTRQPSASFHSGLYGGKLPSNKGAVLPRSVNKALPAKTRNSNG
jgi:S-DNA-T family DNA segregation ATPase FtsK/SpoIIIE